MNNYQTSVISSSFYLAQCTLVMLLTTNLMYFNIDPNKKITCIQLNITTKSQTVVLENEVESKQKKQNKV